MSERSHVKLMNLGRTEETTEAQGKNNCNWKLTEVEEK
jgi:hypothetical protein